MAQPASRIPDSEKGMSLWRSDVLPTLALGLPLAGAQLAQIAINATDVWMISQLGPDELAGSTLAFQFFILLWFFGMGVLQAVIPLVARARSQRKPRELRRAVRMGFWISVLFCISVWGMLIFTETILVALGQEPELARLAGIYMAYLQWTMLPALLIMAVRGFLTVMERTQVVLWNDRRRLGERSPRLRADLREIRVSASGTGGGGHCVGLQRKHDLPLLACLRTPPPEAQALQHIGPDLAVLLAGVFPDGPDGDADRLDHCG